jgi:hypothetical protein
MEGGHRVTVSWWQLVGFLVFEALIDVLIDRVIKNPAGGLWSRFIDWICSREARRSDTSHT